MRDQSDYERTVTYAIPIDCCYMKNISHVKLTVISAQKNEYSNALAA